MRLHTLQVNAFGPFAGQEQIDFDSLAQHGLFLLNGPTGSGKTSILDAVCFALFGSLPGARQGSKSLKSHHAPADAEPWVLLEFTAQGRRLEVRRAPEWQRPSSRSAAGSVTQKASTHVRELLDGQWRALTSRNDEAGALIGGLLGMGREQFTRVVLLPQGDFASFLRARASERGDLLEKLFGTRRFADVEEEVSRRAVEARSAAEAAERTAAAHIVRLEGEIAAHAGLHGPNAEGLVGSDGLVDSDALSGSDGPVDSDAPSGSDALSGSDGLMGSDRLTDPDRPVDPEEALALFARADEAFRRRHEHAEREQQEAGAAQEAARAAAEAAERALDDADELTRARARRAAWEAGADEQAERVRRVADHAAASGLRGPLQESERAAEAAAVAEAGAYASLEAAAATGWVPVGSASEPGAASGAAQGRLLPTVEDVRAAASSAVAEAAVLAERVAVEQELHAFEAQLDDDREALAAASATAEAFTGEGAALDAELARLDQERTGIEAAARVLPAARLEAEAAEAVVAAVQDHADAMRTLAEAEAEHGRRREEALGARQAWLDLRERRLEQTAAELAAPLAEGSPCPVCGSHSHPAPARGAEDPLLIVDAERSAARENDAAAERERRAHNLVGAAQARLAAVDARGGSTDPDKAVRVREEKLEAVRKALEAQRRLELIAVRAAEITERSGAARTGLEEASAARIRAEERVARTGREIERRRAEVDTLRAGFPTVEARRADVAARARTLGTLEEALTVLRTARAAADRAGDALAAALAQTVFPDQTAARRALMDEAQATAAEATVAAYASEGEQLSGLFDAAAVRRALERESNGAVASPEELEAFRTAAGEAESRRRAAALAAREASGARERSHATRERFESCLPALEAARARAHSLNELARTVRGQGENDRRMSLHSYVLAARLEQVATAATERLLAMSDGRFSLEHSDALAARGAASGLGLEIVDGWTGQRRDPSTLSGGESFMASLALALALADVVQHESGGIDIETLFVDEGFGTLDEQALEQVMDAIEGLRAGGRVVGLVSHVAELKQRIPAQIRVTKGRSGSHIESVGLAAGVL